MIFVHSRLNLRSIVPKGSSSMTTLQYLAAVNGNRNLPPCSDLPAGLSQRKG